MPSTPVAGIMPTPAETANGGLAGLTDKTVGIDRDRRDSGAVHSPSRRGGEAALRLPTHPLVDRCARRPSYRSPHGSPAREPGWQRERIENFTTLISGGTGRGEPDRRWLDRRLPQRPVPERTHAAARRGAGRSGEAGATRQLHEDARTAYPGRSDGRKPRHSRGAEALVRPLLQAALLPRRLPARIQSRQCHARRYRRCRRRPHRCNRPSCRQPANTRSTASSTAPASRWGNCSPSASASTSPVGTVAKLSR